MAKFDLKFIDVNLSKTSIQVKVEKNHVEDYINVSFISGEHDLDFCIWLDKSTAIKFAKTLRTEINKIEE